MEITDDIIKELFKSKRYTYNPNILRRYINRIEGKYDKDIYKYLINRYDDSDSLKETLYRIYNGIEQHPICPVCGKPVKMVKGHFQEYCCRLCMQKSELVKENRKKTNLDKYGVTTYLQTKDVVNLAMINSHTKEAILKQQSTNKAKYGYATPFQNKELMDKAILNSHTPIANKKRKNTCLKIYGVTNPVKSKEIREKSKQTCFKKYGVDNYSKTENFKKYISDYISSDKIQNKINNTKRKNNSFNTSKEEEKAYNILKERFNEVKRQYKDKRYPYCCDFYIPENDLFIECNFHWTHGKHPYNSNSLEDVSLLKEWKFKNTKYYNNAINIWTIRDVEKRNIAIKNNLNYIEIYNINELYLICK